MSRMTGGKAVVESLAAHGVKTVFGVVGSTLFSVYDALYEHPSIRLITPRGEDGAGHMADAYARVSGEIGVCLFTVGPGAAFGVSAIGEAYAESWPILTICTQIPTYFLDKNKGVYHECQDQQMLFRPVTAWCHRITRVTDIPEAIAEAFLRLKSGRPRPVFLEIPSDILGQEAEVRIVAPKPIVKAMADDKLIREAARTLLSAKHPVIWAGGGVIKADAGEEVRQLAELLQAPVFSTNGSKGVIPDDHPLMLGNLLTQSPDVERVLNQADAMIAVGTRFSERATRSTDTTVATDAVGRSARGWTVKMPEKLIHIDIDRDELGKNYQAMLPIHADAHDALGKILSVVKQSSALQRPSRAEEIQAVKYTARKDIKERYPQEIHLLDVLREALPRDTIVSAQSIPGHWARFTLEMYHPRSFLFANSFGSMGFAFHAAIGAKIALPQRPVVVLCGDGGFLFGCGEMATIAQYKLPLPVVIFNNGGFKILQTTQMRRFGRVVGTDMVNPDFIKLGEAFGFNTKLVKDEYQLADSIVTALKADRATLIEAQIEFEPREIRA